MKSRHSQSLVLVWRVAEFEARHVNASSIEPTHLLLGLCKVVDLDLTAVVSKVSPDRDEVLEELLREIRRLRTVFQVAGLNAKLFRRRLRHASPERRFSMEESERLRRSPAAKKIFAAAEHFSQLAGGTVYPVHLLYAALLGDDDHRDAILAELKVEKKRIQEIARREVLVPQPRSVPGSKQSRTKWN